MKVLAALVCLILPSFPTLAQTADSVSQTAKTSGYRMKGIDFSLGPTLFIYSKPDIRNLTSQITNDYSGYYGFKQAHLNSWTGNKGTDVLTNLYLGFVFTPNKSSQKRLFFRQEFRMGLSYTFSGDVVNVNMTWDSTINGNTVEKRGLDYSYRSNTERFHLSYLLNSRPFMSYFALYTGLGVSAGMTQWNVSGSDIQAKYNQSSYQLPHNNASSSTTFLPVENYTTTLLGAYIPIGIKYNFSCDLNLFLETQQGVNMFSKGLESDFKINYTPAYSIGLRYKIIDEQDRINHKTNLFW